MFIRYILILLFGMCLGNMWLAYCIFKLIAHLWHRNFNINLLFKIVNIIQARKQALLTHFSLRLQASKYVANHRDLHISRKLSQMMAHQQDSILKCAKWN